MESLETGSSPRSGI